MLVIAPDPAQLRTRQQAASQSAFDTIIAALAGLIMPGLIVAAAVLARRNVLLGHGDRRGAFEAAAVMFTLAWVRTREY